MTSGTIPFRAAATAAAIVPWCSGDRLEGNGCQGLKPGRGMETRKDSSRDTKWESGKDISKTVKA